jgi:hypothetical protein
LRASVAAALQSDGVGHRRCGKRRPGVAPARHDVALWIDQQLTATDHFAPEREVADDETERPVGIAEEGHVLGIERERRKLL